MEDAQRTVRLSSGKTHFRSIAVVERVFDHQSLEHLDGNLTDLSELLKSPAHLSQQQPHQEVVSTEVITQRIVQLKICSRHQSTQMTLSQRREQESENKRNIRCTPLRWK